MDKFILTVSGFCITALVIAMGMLGYCEHSLYNEFPRGAKVKFLDSDIVGTVNGTSFPCVNIVYIDDFNAIREAEVNYKLLTKVK